MSSNTLFSIGICILCVIVLFATIKNDRAVDKIEKKNRKNRRK
jgi:hypothetical protein